MIQLTTHPTARGVFEDKKKRRLYTLNLVPGQMVYGEFLVRFEGKEYREWVPNKSKLAAGLVKGVKSITFEEGVSVLYLGVASGTTASHISDIIGKQGMIFGVDLSPISMRQLVFLAQQRRNISPILEDATHPHKYQHRICMCDYLIQDIAQKNQIEIFLKNLQFLKPNGVAILSLKSRSIDITKQPKEIYESVKIELEKNINLIDWKTLEPFEKDHALFVMQKNG